MAGGHDYSLRFGTCSKKRGSAEPTEQRRVRRVRLESNSSDPSRMAPWAPLRGVAGEASEDASKGTRAASRAVPCADRFTTFPALFAARVPFEASPRCHAGGAQGIETLRPLCPSAGSALPILSPQMPQTLQSNRDHWNRLPARRSFILPCMRPVASRGGLAWGTGWNYDV